MSENYQIRLPMFGLKSKEIDCKIEKLEGRLQELMIFLYETMPLSDIANYEFELFLEYAKHGLKLLESTSVPKEIFLNYVLYPRINNESLENCREFFYHEVINELGEIKDTKESVLAINYFCGSHVTYKASDDRTASPKSIYLKGHGRCGEQSTMVCSIYRSVGIPARQVYSKRWSHCDDNHAWVEIYLQGEWFFLGACEPEEVLNKGWFLVASSRSMLIHHRTFGVHQVSPDFIERQGNSEIYNELKTYAETIDLQVSVEDEKGNPTDCIVNFGILNYAEICNIAQIATVQGKCHLETGQGSIVLSVYQDGFFVEEVIDTRSCRTVTLVLTKKEPIEEWKEFQFVAPKDKKINKGSVTKEEIESGKKRFMEATRKRLSRKYGNDQIDDLAISKTLLEKDLYDTKRDILIEHEQVENSLDIPNEIFANYVVCPRVYYENITGYKTFIKEYFSEKTKNEFRENPKLVFAYINDTISFHKEEEYEEIYTTPKALLEIKSGNEMSKKILFVAIVRSLGIPARLNEVDLSLEYYQKGQFVKVEEKSYGMVTLLNEDKPYGMVTLLNEDKSYRMVTLLNEDKVKWEYFNNISLSKYQNNQFETLNLSNSKFMNQQLKLEIGRYKIITSNRIPNGNILAKTFEFELKTDSKLEIKLILQQATKEDMYHINQIEDFTILDEKSENVSASSIFKNPRTLLIWLEPTKEPTEHILNELFENKEKFLERQIQISLILPDKEAKNDPTIKKILMAINGIEIFYDKNGDCIEPIARKMNVDPDRLPLILLMKENLTGIYANSGYNVGTAEMILKLI